MSPINKYVPLILIMGQFLHCSPYLVPVSMLSVSVRRRRRARTWSVPVGPAGLLAPGLLLGSTMGPIISLRRTDCMVNMAWVTCALVVWSGSVPGKQRETLVML